MKPVFLLCICLCAHFLLQAQASKTVEVTTPGSLHTLLTPDELTTITDLTLTGQIDARDFWTMRDSMIRLENVDMEKVTINGFNEEGDLSDNSNIVPNYAFSEGLSSQGHNRLKSIILPSRAHTIGYAAFYSCRNLESVTFPATLLTIHNHAFRNCSALRSLYFYGINLPELPSYDFTSMHFNNVNKDTCILYVPYGSKEVYDAAYPWHEFKNIVEMPRFQLSDTYVKLPSLEGSQTTVELLTESDWTVTSDQSWLTISPTSGIGNQTLTFTAKENTTSASRAVIVRFTAAELLYQTIVVRQEEPFKSFEVEAGGLSSALTQEELRGVMHLILTGTIDARDFKIMRDSMPVLTTLDISQVNIVAYSGTEGTFDYNQHINYPANEIPFFSFNNKTSLTVVKLPLSATSIGDESFYRCKELTEVDYPLSLISIGNNAFNGCIKLTSVALPEGLKTIGDDAFSECTALTSADIPSTVTYLGYGVFRYCPGLTSVLIPSGVTVIKAYTFLSCSGLASVTIPASVTSLEEGAFGGCTKLTSITIPVSVTRMGPYVFGGCSGLTSIIVNRSTPVDLSAASDIFTGVNVNTCKLIVPYQSKALYAAAAQWKEFKNIEEATSGFILDVNHLEYDAAQHNYTFGIAANVAWSVSADQPWISFDKNSGNGDQVVTLTLEANTGTPTRWGLITVSAPGATSQVITVTQEGLPATFTITAGGLSTALTDDELKGITSLTLEGSMDARDFKTIRDKMPLLYNLNLSKTTVVAYSGTEGTIFNPFISFDYRKDAIPTYAFYSEINDNDHFKTIILPQHITSIGENTFTSCNGLTTLEIPKGVTDIGHYGFNGCMNLTSIVIPSTVTAIGDYAFSECKSLETIELPPITTISEFLFTDCDHLISITIPTTVTRIKSVAFAGCRSLKTITIPSSVIRIDQSAFAWCTGLESISIPASVEWIGEDAFNGCSSLQKIYAYKTIPIVFSAQYENFFNVNKETCILYVPAGSMELYAEANEWKDFQHIVEMTTAISDRELNKFTFRCYPNPFTGQMTIDIENPSLREVFVEIYSLSGQKIKTLVRAQKGAKISCAWDGSNEQGQQVPQGMYLLRVNKETRKVVKGL